MKRPPDDPHVTDLNRYRKQREQAKRRASPKPPGEPMLGSNRHAGVILALVVIVILAFFVIPRLL